MNIITSALIAAVLGCGITGALGFVIIPWLKKMHFGQTILEIGPSWHKNKEGTPNMGGLMYIIGVLCASLATMAAFYFSKSGTLESIKNVTEGSDMVLLFGGLLLAAGCAVIGFLDDYAKVSKKQNMGLNSKQKTVLQVLVAFAFLLSLYLSGNTWWYIPFMGKVDVASIAFGLPYWVLGIMIIYGTVNAVNLTDGIDGLCSSVTVPVAITFIAIAVLQNFAGLGIIAASLLGACVGFLFWNWNPAKVFMGDTGSLFLGGLVVAMAYAAKCPLILLPVGIVYVCETMSVIIQVTYFKLTHGKRIFKMSPIHHHFEMVGWKEKKICAVFTVVSIIGCAVGYVLMYFGECF